MWIADTGVTTHSMAHPNHGHPREAKESDNVMGVAGPPVQAAKIIDIPSVMTNWEGHKMATIMSNITYVPSGWYKMFSITKLMKNS